MKLRSVDLETVCGPTSALPQNAAPEVAFAGRSNVGKSSLINALLGRKSLARTSSRPGKTQTINFYHINPGVTPEEEAERGFAPDLYLVDLPGYGYAGVPEAEKAKWGPMIERYLNGSKMLKGVFLLADIRHKPTKDDLQMAEWIARAGFRPVILATKQDKLKRSQVAKNLRELRAAFSGVSVDVCLSCSAEKREGMEEIWNKMKDVIGEEG